MLDMVSGRFERMVSSWREIYEGVVAKIGEDRGGLVDYRGYPGMLKRCNLHR